MAKAAIAKYDPGLHGHGETAHDVRGVCGEAESFERRMICNGAVRSVLRAARTEERVREGGGAAVGKAGQVGDEEMHQNGKRKKKKPRAGPKSGVSASRDRRRAATAKQDGGQGCYLT